MPFLVLIFVAAVVWFLVSPFIVFGLWNRLNELESSVKRLQSLGKSRPEPTHDRFAVPSETSAVPVVAPLSIPVPHQTHPTSAASVAVTSPHEAPRLRDEIPLTELLAPRPIRPGATLDKIRAGATGEGLHSPVLHEDTGGSKLLPVTTEKAASASVARLHEDRTGKSAHPPVAAKAAVTGDEPSTLEEILAGKWLTWVGALAVIIGAGFGFKYAVDNGYLDPTRRVILGLVVGLLSFGGGAYAMRRDYRFLGQGLTGAAMGILYMSCFAAHVWHGLIPYEVALLGMALTTAGGLAFASRFESQPTAFLGLLGGFLTPAMLHGATDQFWVLFPYVLLLDAGVLYVSTQRRWLGLQNLAFVGTCLTWWTWYVWFYDLSKLVPTIAFLSAFFVLFALIGVMQNIVRQQKAVAGDFFLILVAPVAYFGAVYGLTHIVFENWQGLFALGMMVIYGYLAILNAQINPQGKPVAAALAGLAGTFLIIAAPIQFTGHWVTVAWIAESVLLVEIGLRFKEKTLTLTGVTLLAKVQIILLIYALGTFADPVGFQTAFVRKQLHLIGGPSALETSWTNIFNGRSFSYLVDVLGLGWLAWQCRRRAKSGQSDDLFGMKSRDLELWLAAGVPLIALMLAITETFAWGMLRQWHGLTILCGFTMWAALVGVALIAWSVFIGPRPLEKLGWFLFVLMGGALLLNLGWTTVGIMERGIDEVNWAANWWLLNPRGFAFLTVFGAGVLTALIYRTAAALHTDERESKDEPVPLDRLFGSAAFVLALTMVLLETFAWGKTSGWTGVSILSAFTAWASLFGAGLAVWKFVRKSVGLEGLLVSTFVLLGSFLAMNSIATLERAQHGALTVAATLTTAKSTDAAIDWWLLNPRGLSFLLAVGAALLAARLERSSRQARSGANERLGNAITRGEQFGLMACFVGLAVVLLETTAWGMPRLWFTGTLASSLALGTAPFALGLAVWATWYRRRVINGAVGTVFVLLGLCLFISGLAALDSHSALTSASSSEATVHLWLFHPRGAAFLVGLAVAGLAAALYLRVATGGTQQRLTDGDDLTTFEFDTDALTFSQTLGVSAWLAGLAMFTIEAVAQGAARHWQTETSLAITLSWTAYALGTLIAGIYWRSGTVRVLSLSVFMLTVAKVFLFDVWHLDTVIRVFAFISLGVTLLLVSFLYRHYRERIRDWIAPAV